MTSRAQESEHEADEAGGEAIYSSEGLAPVSIPPPPIIVTPWKNSDENEDKERSGSCYLDTSSSVHPREAFQVFSGKVFRGTVYGDHSNFGKGQVESPLERLARLRWEVSELERDFGHDENENGDENRKAEEMAKEVTQVTQRLEALGEGMRSVHDHSKLKERQAKLTHLVKDKVDQILKNNGDGETNDASKSGIVYELYSNGTGSITGTDNETGASEALEERLARIESLVGSASRASSQTSILDRLQEAEARVRSLDDEVLRTASARAKVIR